MVSGLLRLLVPEQTKITLERYLGGAFCGEVRQAPPPQMAFEPNSSNLCPNEASHTSLDQRIA